jgi:group I intron endonuclease
MRGIYKIINTINNKFYVGSAVCTKRRKARHFSELRHNKHNNKYLQNSWNKYGEEAFIFIVLEEIAEKEDLLEAENVWLRLHVGKPHCYNIGVNATAPMLGMCGELSPAWGYRHTKESLEKISISSKNRVCSPETRKKISSAHLGRKLSMESRQKISQAIMGEKNHNYGKPRSQSFRDKVSKIIEVMDSKENTIFYPSITSLRECLQLKPATINRSLKSGKPISKGKYSGWSFKYA